MKAKLGVGRLPTTVDRIRRNHALEHATIHMLNAGEQSVRLMGRSDHRGFTLYGNVSREAVMQAVCTALHRMRSGERHLALHPYCGTNFVTAGVFASVAALIAGAGSKRMRFERLPALVSLVTLALIFSQPIGMVIQRDVTTNGSLGDLDIVSVTRRQIGVWILHRVETSD